MISNERPSPYGRQPYGPRTFSDYQPKPRVAEDTLKQSEVLIERKTFTLALKENPRGRFLRIVENVGNGAKFASIIIPITGIVDFQRMLADMVKADGEIPPKNVAPLTGSQT